MSSLQKWMGVLQETIFQLMPKLSLQTQDKLKNRLMNYVQTYEEPQLDEDGNLLGKLRESTTRAEDEENKAGELLDDDDENMEYLKSQIPLGEGVLKVNLGIPIIVVCMKADLLIRGEKA